MRMPQKAEPLQEYLEYDARPSYLAVLIALVAVVGVSMSSINPSPLLFGANMYQEGYVEGYVEE